MVQHGRKGKFAYMFSLERKMHELCLYIGDYPKADLCNLYSLTRQLEISWPVSVSLSLPSNFPSH